MGTHTITIFQHDAPLGSYAPRTLFEIDRAIAWWQRPTNAGTQRARTLLPALLRERQETQPVPVQP